MTKFCFFTLSLLSVFLLSCSSPPRLVSERNLNDFDYSVAEASQGYSLNMSQLYQYLRESKLANRGGILSVEEVADFVDSLVLDTIMGMEANDLDLKVDPARYMIFRRQYLTFLRNVYMESEVIAAVTVDSQEVIDHYSGNEMYLVNEQVLVSHITMTEREFLEGPDSASYTHLSKDELAEKVQGHFYSVYEMLQDDSSFESMARRYSHDKYSAAQGGSVGRVEKGWYADPFDSVAFSIEPGTYSEPYLNKNGWHLIYVEKHIDSGIPPLTPEVMPSVWTNYYNLKSNERAQELVDSIRRDEPEIVYNEAMLEADYFKEKITSWVAIVNGRDSIPVFDLTKLEADYRKKYNIPITTPEMKKEMISAVASVVVITQAARDTRIDTLPLVVARHAETYHRHAKQVIADYRFDMDYRPSEEEIRKYYEDHLDSFVTDKPLEVQQIICEDSTFCEYIRDQALAGVDFLELAAKHYPGDPKVRVDLADLGRVGPGDVDSTTYRIASTTKTGTITHPIKTKYGYQIIKLVNRYDSKSLGQVKAGIVTILSHKHADEFYENHQEELFSRYNVSSLGKLHRVHLRPYEDRQG